MEFPFHTGPYGPGAAQFRRSARQMALGKLRGPARNPRSGRFPPFGDPPRDREKDDPEPDQHGDLGPDRPDRLVSPEDLLKPVERPGIEGDEPDLLELLGH